MIRVTRRDGKQIVINADWIQSVEQTPETLITLTSGVRLMVQDSVDEVVRAYQAYRKQCGALVANMQVEKI